MYCMPAEGVDLTPRSQTLSSDEIVQLVSMCYADSCLQCVLYELKHGPISLQAEVLGLSLLD